MKDSFIDLLYPPSCAGCDEPLLASSGSNILCQHCYPHTLDYIRSSKSCCRICGESDSLSAENICLQCRISPFRPQSIHSLWHYHGRIEALIKRFKYCEQRRLADFFAAQLADAIMAANSKPRQRWDYLVPLPSALPTMQRRGYHHTALIVRKLARLLEIPWLPLALRSPDARLAQAQLPPAERLANVSGAFVASPRQVSGTRILLIDDMLTTGASISAAADALYSSGAATVDAYTLARSQQFRTHRMSAAALLWAESAVAEQQFVL